ncbi:hypothetical protein Pmani_033948 [Petrolisthes manimaculis]|uniref:Uncharacterized protein n=1 Tax=Petrolisthes manimaculis TaxID=1843537 RepID=A0AAE1NQX7_9EUCA|nr:hypothetical protein Pmani_033948 [Petrolisthes manimaculis]
MYVRQAEGREVGSRKEKGRKVGNTVVTMSAGVCLCCRLPVLFLLCLVGSKPGLGFNVDIGNHVTHYGDQVGSMFGFAVAQHKDQGQAK